MVKKSGKKARRGGSSVSSGRLHKLISGSRIPVSPNPPPVNSQPWMPFTICWHTNQGTFDVENLTNYFKLQIDPAGLGLNKNPFNSSGSESFRVQFRLFSVCAWNVTGRLISLTVFDHISPGAKDQLCGFTDCGSGNGFPGVGYRYPSAQQGVVIRPDDTNCKTDLFHVGTSGKTDAVLIHVRLTFRFDGNVKFQAADIMTRESIILNNLTQLTSDSTDQTANIAAILKAIKDAQPSTLEKVVDGAKKVAGLVTVVADSQASASTSSDTSFDSMSALLEALAELPNHRDKDNESGGGSNPSHNG